MNRKGSSHHLAEANADIVMVTAAERELHNARAIWTDIQREELDT